MTFSFDTPNPDLVVTLDIDDARTVELLGHFALPLDAPEVRREIIGKQQVVLINKDALAGTCFALGVPDVILVQIPPEFRSLREHLGLGPQSESPKDIDDAVRTRWRSLLDRSHLLRPEDYPTATNVSTTTGLPDYSSVPFPVHCLPVALHDLVVEGAASQGVDQAMWGVPQLGAIAGAIGNVCRLLAKPNYWVKSILWTVTVCPSGAGKSPPLDTLFAPHRERDRRLIELSNQELLTYHAALEAAKRDKREHPEGPPPRRCVLVDDTTLEALIANLRDNPFGLTMVRDEFAGFIEGMDAYRGGRGGDETRWLQLYDGRMIKVDRKGGDRSILVVSDPACSLVGTVQPGVLRSLFSARRWDSGFVSRFLLAMPAVIYADWTEQTISASTLDRYRQVVNTIFRAHDEGLRTELVMSHEARAVWSRFFNSINAELRDTCRIDDKHRSHLVKLRASALRIAIVLAVADAADRGFENLRSLGEISADTMRNAVELTRWFIGQQVVLYGHLRIAQNEPESLIEVITRLGGRTSVRDLMRATRRFKDAAQARNALDVLVRERRGTWDIVRAANGHAVEVFVLLDPADADDAVDADASA